MSESHADRPVFVLGCARSGTTLLQLMLHAHPRIAIPPETRFIPEAYSRRLAFGDLLEPRNRDRLVDWIVDRKESKFRDLGLDADAVRRRAHEVAPTLGSVLAVFLEQYAARWGKPRWGDKRPGYFRRMPVLLRLFPDAQFIHIVRDGRDCVASLKRMPWWEHGVPRAIYYWVQAMQVSDWARASLPAGQYAEVRYEDLVAEPHDQLERLCEFLGEPFDEAMVEPHAAAADAVPKRKRSRWHQRTTEEVSTGAIGKFRNGLDPDELRLMEFVAGRRLRERGYELSGRRAVPDAALLATYSRHVLRVRLGGVRLERRERDRDARYPWPVEAVLPLEAPAIGVQQVLAQSQPQPSAGHRPSV